MSGKHTPGPWYAKEHVEPAGHGRIDICRQWDNEVKPEASATYGSYLGAHIAKVEFNTGVVTRDQANANAHLIAAAPDLLSALQRLDRIERGLEAWHEDARAEAWQQARAALAKATEGA